MGQRPTTISYDVHENFADQYFEEHPKDPAQFKKETIAEKNVRLARLSIAKSNFTHAWKVCKEHAWLWDEVKPLSGDSQDPFGGCTATLVDSLGT